MDESVSTITSTLLARVQARDSRAWEQLVDVYGPLVYRWCLQRGLHPEQAEDVGQEVFLAVSRSLGSFENVSFPGWLKTITHRKIIDAWKQNGKQPIADGGTDGHRRMNDVPAESAECDDDDERVVQSSLLELVRHEFTEQDVLAFCRVVIDEKSPADVARDLNISRNKVYLAKSRILQRLRNRLGADKD